MSLIKDEPSGLGRVVRNSKGELAAIVEEKDATEKQKEIKEVNDGFYKIAIKQNKKVTVYKLEKSDEWVGVNTKKQLKIANEKMLDKLRKEIDL